MPQTNEEILEKAVELAIDRGWEFDNLDKWQWCAIHKTDTVMTNWYYFLIVYDGKEKFIDAERVIYDQLFAKALWPGNTGYCNSAEIGQPATEPIWLSPSKFHLQQMVISPDPIQYLGQHMPESGGGEG